MPKKTILTRLSSYNYRLPVELIAQEPARPVESARLMLLNKITGVLSHRRFFDLPKILQPGDVLVFNNSKVIPARLNGQKATGGKIEIFLLKKLAEGWQVMIGGKVKEGQEIFLTQDVKAQVLEKLENNLWLVKFNVGDQKIFTYGKVPTPPYIKAAAKMSDYQTVFAKTPGSVAAPTAGLHFSKKLLASLKKSGVEIEFVTLHVGLGTFLPVKVEDILEHQMHSELAEISGATAKKLNQAKKSNRRIIAVGTTALRTLESFSEVKGKVKSGRRETNIFIYPGYQFKFVDALVTNFHLPQSTLLMLVSALAGKKHIDRAYQEAIKNQYQFFSFGDGMFIY